MGSGRGRECLCLVLKLKGCLQQYSPSALLWMAQDLEDLILGVCKSCKFLTPLLGFSFVVCFSVKLLQHKPRYSSDPRHHTEAVGNIQGTVVPSSFLVTKTLSEIIPQQVQGRLNIHLLFLQKQNGRGAVSPCNAKGRSRRAEKRKANSCLNLPLRSSDPKRLFGNPWEDSALV